MSIKKPQLKGLPSQFSRRPRAPARPALFPGYFILSEQVTPKEVKIAPAEDPAIYHSYEILRSLRSPRMTGTGTFAEIPTWYQTTKSRDSSGAGNR
jgi:hypothetical protein